MTSLLSFIKEATDAVKTKNENIRIIEETEKQLKILEEKIKQGNLKLEKIHIEIQKAPEEKNKKLASLDLIMEHKAQEIINLEKIIEEKNHALLTLVKSIKDLDAKAASLEKSIKTTHTRLRNDPGTILNSSTPNHPIDEKKNSILKLHSVLTQCKKKLEEFGSIPNGTMYVPTLPKKASINTTVKKEDTPTPLNSKDKNLNLLLYKFAEKYDKAFDLVIPTVLDYLHEYITTGSENAFKWDRKNISYSFTRESMRIFYDDHLSAFLSLLRKKEYAVKGNEKIILRLLRMKALEINYKRLKDDFYLMDQFNKENCSLDDIMYNYIKIAGKNNIRSFSNLGFLCEFLKKIGYGNFDHQLLVEDKMLREAEDAYDVIILEKELGLAESSDHNRKDLITLEQINDMSGSEFEVTLSTLLKKIGFRTAVTKGSGDQGVDILAEKDGKKYAIQAKRYSNSVGNKAVQEVVSGMSYYEADVSWVITNSTFTQAAVNLAKKTNTTLWDGNKLETMLEIYNM